MRTLDRLNIQGAKIEQIRPELSLTEKSVESPDLVNVIDRTEGNKLSLQDRIGIYHNPDHISIACKEVTETMNVYLGTGMKFADTSVGANPINPMSKLAYTADREGGMIGVYDFTQKPNPLYGTYN